MRIARVVTRERCGSNLLLGASWLDPGEETNTWSSSDEPDVGADDHWYGPVDETYFIINGRFELDYEAAAAGDDRGVLELTPHDCVYLAPRLSLPAALHVRRARLLRLLDDPVAAVSGHARDAFFHADCLATTPARGCSTSRRRRWLEVPEIHPESAPRVRNMRGALHGVLGDRLRWRDGRHATADELATLHDTDYVEEIRAACAARPRG